MNFKERPLNSSLIKKFLYRGEERELICPFRILREDILKTDRYQSDSMTKGSYFETLCLGRGANDSITNDLPRKRLTKKQEIENQKRAAQGLEPLKGDKTLDQVRIDNQAVIFHELTDKYQVTVTNRNTQVKLIIPWHKDPEVLISSEMDIFPTAIMTNDGLRLAIIDLKLTADINTTFGEFCWGSPEYMDITQALLYLYCVRNLIDHIDLNPHMRDLLTKPAINIISQDLLHFYYWVFGYKKIQNKLIRVTSDATRAVELYEAINKTLSLIEYYEALDWPAKPNYKLCNTCPIKDCTSRQLIQEI